MNMSEHFDSWRRNYDSMSLQDQKNFHADFFSKWPEQHFHSEDKHLPDFIEMLPEGSSVIEIGGWMGNAAELALSSTDKISTWKNIEICQEAIDASVCSDTRYVALCPDIWPWDMDNSGYNALFMQHVIEHMRVNEFIKLLESMPDVRYIFVQSPLNLDTNPHRWDGYPGCHIFEYGWDDLDAKMGELGFEVVSAWLDEGHENTRTKIYKK